MDYDLHHSSKVEIALDIQGSSDTVVGEIMDSQGFGSLEYLIHVEITSGIWDMKFEHGENATLSDAEVVPAELIFGNLTSFDSGDNPTARRMGSTSKKRYQRVTIVETSAGIGNFAATGLFHNAIFSPSDD